MLTRNSARPPGQTSRMAPNSSSPPCANTWKPTSICSRHFDFWGMGRSFSDLQRFEELVVGIAETPLLAGLQRLDHRMLGGVRVLGGVLVLRGVAAADVTATQAQSQVHPLVADGQAFLAAVAARLRSEERRVGKGWRCRVAACG